MDVEAFVSTVDQTLCQAQVNLEPCADDPRTLVQVFPSGEMVNIAKSRGAFQKLFPLLLPHLTLEDALTCRLVCSSWKSVIDEIFGNAGLTHPNYASPEQVLQDLYEGEDYRKHPFSFRYGWHCRNVAPDGTLIITPREAYEQKLLQFQREMDPYTGNPFVFRSVTFCCLDKPAYVAHVTRFLERFGGHVWKLYLEGVVTGPHATVVLRDLLQLTPNLRLLSLNFGNDYQRRLEAQELKDLQEMLRNSPVPELPHLTSLQVGYSDLFNSNLVFCQFALGRWMDHVQELRLWDASLLRHWNGHFPQLKLLVLAITPEEEIDIMYNLWGPQTQLWHLTNWKNSPLENITIQAEFRLPLDIYFEVFRTFAQTLRCVTIDYTEDDELRVKEYFHARNRDLQFPKLETVKLVNPCPEESLGMLIRLKPGIKTLIITADRDYLEEDEQSKGNEWYESDIWKKLPTLDGVKEERVYDDEKTVRKEYTRQGKAKYDRQKQMLAAKGNKAFRLAVCVHLFGMGVLIAAYSQATWFTTAGSRSQVASILLKSPRLPSTSRICSVYKNAIQPRNSSTAWTLCPQKTPLVYFTCLIPTLWSVSLFYLDAVRRMANLRRREIVFRRGELLSLSVGLLTAVAGLCFLLFLWDMTSSSSWCSDSTSFQEFWKGIAQEAFQAQEAVQQENPPQNATLAVYGPENWCERKPVLEFSNEYNIKSCGVYNHKVFQPVLILVGGLATTIAGFLYLFASSLW